MYLRKNYLISINYQNKSTETLNNEDLDDPTFNLWKTELEKELPEFWESIEDPIKPRRRFSASS